MALWGNLDALVAAPKYLAPTRVIDGTDVAVVLVGSDTIVSNDHGFVTGDPVTYTSTGAIGGLASGTVYYVIRVDDDQFQLAANAVDAAAGTEITISGVGTATDDTIQKTPSNLYFVDFEESQQAENIARGLNGPGWWLYDSYTDAHGETRHKAECIVPMVRLAADAGDQSDDAVVVDRTITIDAQPVAASVTSPDPATFTVAASVDPASALTFQWQVSTDGGNIWASSTSGGNTTSTLTVSFGEADYLDANQFRVIVSSSGATDVTSDAVLLTIL